MISKSIVNHGDLAMYSGVFEKLSANRCLRITAIGGSVTQGHFNHTLIPAQMRWPEQLEQLLNMRFPCTDPAGGHKVSNQGRGSTTPGLWVEKLVGQQEEIFRGVDLVIIETAVNQVAGREQSQMDAEVLMSLVTKQTRRLALNKDPAASNPTPATAAAAAAARRLALDGSVAAAAAAGTAAAGNGSSDLQQQTAAAVRSFTGTAVMWVVASTRRFTPVWTGVPYERVSDAMYAQLPVAQHHGVPIISVIDALGPFPTPALQAWFNDTWYRGDMVHPSVWGHTLLADLVYRYVDMAYQHSRLWQMYDLPKQYVPREPRFADPQDLDMFLDARPVSITLCNMGDVSVRKVTQCNGWWAYADVPEKIGYIASRPNAECVLSLTPPEVRRLSLGKAHVMLLKSYENMGVFEMTIMAGPAAANGSCKGAADNLSSAAVLGSAEVDCLWDEHASLGKVAKVEFKLPPQDNATCLLAKLKVKDVNRAKNKVKLLGIQFF
ncbi:hypothetical protein PLESTB_001320300 [Pleodorina starrii]|uniref:SGNH hydrolase-type esterase domain-containing protein n=1 Tax=Pleodorina starrii TaxID=330485 RepID=A0A9W6BTX5_9CHLO|nr:hypothetical protein PLESTM_001616400 [Pleodorina starrii]GLC58119.1 hypothetical protein PLESTB_001320300 [Pleodorina starrii]GLC66808.1 hypothetical protein PLESTF_000476600 [Pleodorina starrii]